MTKLTPLLLITLCACPGPILVPVSELDAGRPQADAGGPPRLVRVVYAMQVEPDERAAYEAIRASVPTAGAGVELSIALFAFGEQGQALLQPFAPRDVLPQRGFSPASLVVKDGVVGPPQVQRGHADVAELVVADFETLPPADQRRVEYRVFFLTDGVLHAQACQQQRAECQPADAALVCCSQDVIGNSRRMRSVVELWSASRVTLQPVAISTGAPRSTIEHFLLMSLAREGGTSLVETTLTELPTTLASLTAKVVE